MTARLVVAAILAAVVAAPAAACGADPVDPEVVASAADSTAGAGAARMEMTVEIQGQTLHGTGVVDAARERSRVTLTVPQAGAFESRFVGGVMYQRVPDALNRLPDGKHWAMIDLDRYLRGQGVDLGALESAAGEPWSHVAELRGATRVERVGAERVRGVPTTRYEAEVDLRAAAARSTAARRSVDRLIELTGGETTYPVEVWLDGDGRVRRERLIRTLAGGETATTTIELHGFGAADEVAPPPAGDTVDLTDRAP